ncbi:MAG: PAAR domain-containing protein, partial [Candidatus Thiodiazotropha sp.]
MSGKPAARVGDTILCMLPQTVPATPPPPHAPPPGLPIMPPGAATVLIGGKPAARMGDFRNCLAPVPTP